MAHISSRLNLKSPPIQLYSTPSLHRLYRSSSCLRLNTHQYQSFSCFISQTLSLSYSLFHSGLSYPGRCSCPLVLVLCQQLSPNGRVPEIHLLILNLHLCLFGNPIDTTVRIRIVHSRRRVRCDRNPRRMRLPLNLSGSDPVYYSTRLRYIINNRNNICIGRTQILVPLRLVRWKIPVHNLPKCF